MRDFATIPYEKFYRSLKRDRGIWMLLDSIESIEDGVKIKIPPLNNHMILLNILFVKYKNFHWSFEEPYLFLKKGEIETEIEEPKMQKNIKKPVKLTQNIQFVKPIAYQGEGKISIDYDDPRGVIIHKEEKKSIKLLCPSGSIPKKISEEECGCEIEGK